MQNCYCQGTLFYRTCQWVSRLIGAVIAATWVVAIMVGCATPERYAQTLARSNGLEPLLLQGTQFQHHAFAAVRGPPGLLVLFIEGDGSPWKQSGWWVVGHWRPAADPTPRLPLALELAAATPAAVLYLGRPCYLEVIRPPGCSEPLWTSQRYSHEVVASMSAAATKYIAEHHFEQVLIVGYSGGGTLAALMARDLPHVSGLVTIAGNLDPDAWTQLHGYLPLRGSVNPSLQPPLPADLKQWYLVGERDSNVSAAATARYFARIPQDRVWSYARFDHKCCWVEAWPSIFATIAAQLHY
jgi:pimeloyl-ACP methyl ester carboxylesterase